MARLMAFLSPSFVFFSLIRLCCNEAVGEEEGNYVFKMSSAPLWKAFFFNVTVGGTARKWPRLFSTGLIARCDCRLRNSVKTMVWQSVSFSGGGLCGAGQLSPTSSTLLTANPASPSPAGYHRCPATPTEICRPLRLTENCFSFSWEWVIWHAGIVFQLSFFFFFKQRRLNNR